MNNHNQIKLITLCTILALNTEQACSSNENISQEHQPAASASKKRIYSEISSDENSFIKNEKELKKQAIDLATSEKKEELSIEKIRTFSECIKFNFEGKDLHFHEYDVSGLNNNCGFDVLQLKREECIQQLLNILENDSESNQALFIKESAINEIITRLYETYDSNGFEDFSNLWQNNEPLLSLHQEIMEIESSFDRIQLEACRSLDLPTHTNTNDILSHAHASDSPNSKIFLDTYEKLNQKREQRRNLLENNEIIKGYLLTYTNNKMLECYQDNHTPMTSIMDAIAFVNGIHMTIWEEQKEGFQISHQLNPNDYAQEVKRSVNILCRDQANFKHYTELKIVEEENEECHLPALYNENAHIPEQLAQAGFEGVLDSDLQSAFALHFNAMLDAPGLLGIELPDGLEIISTSCSQSTCIPPSLESIELPDDLQILSTSCSQTTCMPPSLEPSKKKLKRSDKK